MKSLACSLLVLSFLIVCSSEVRGEVPLTGMKPSYLRIPSLGIHAEVHGVKKDGIETVPPKGDVVFWYEDGINPGARGHAIFAGHFDDYVGPAIFYDLRNISIGDMVYVTGENGELMMFNIVEKTSLPLDEIAMEDIYRNNDAPSLFLITCDGFYDTTEKTHVRRLIVEAEKVGNTY